MSATPDEYLPLDIDTLPSRLVVIPAVANTLGADISRWQVSEVGDGNLNLVFTVVSPLGGLVVKQALPYVRLVGDSWPLPLSRSFFEYHALMRQMQRAPGSVPVIHHFDETQALIVMEYLRPHHILRFSLQQGIKHEGLGQMLGNFCANTLFKGSDFFMDASERKQDVALFAGNTALCDITESLVFTDPYFDAEMNRHTSPQLDEQVALLRADSDAKIAAQMMKLAFCSRAETLLHGDLHTGSVMVHESDAKVIDPEFALYGPMGFDIGMLLANFIMASCAQPAYATEQDNRKEYQLWILQVIDDIWTSFAQRFTQLWGSQRNGILFPAELFEKQEQAAASAQALEIQLRTIWVDAMGFCGAEIIRRTLGLAHIAEFEDIENADHRAVCESAGLKIGRRLMVERQAITSMASLVAVIQEYPVDKLAQSAAQSKTGEIKA